MKIQADIYSNAYCLPAIYDLNISVVGSGSVLVNPLKSKYAFGDVINITALPAVNYQFLTWRKGSISTNPNLSLTVTGNINLTARFNKPQTTRIIISDSDPTLVHGNQVKTAFLNTYLACAGVAFPDTIEIKIESLYESLVYADNVGAELIIRSTSGAGSFLQTAQSYYPTQLFMPAGSNVHHKLITTNGNLPSMILTGEGTVNNLTAYDVESFCNDPFGGGASSFSNAKIAGIIAAAVDSSYHNAGFKDYAAARYYLRKGKVWNDENGYGYLDYAALIDAANVNEYLANVALDPEHYRKLDQYMFL